MANSPVNLFDVANNGKALKRYVNGTLEKYNNAFVALHNAACMTVFHAAQFGECSHLNAFYNGLKVNDQTALRVWIAANFTLPVEGEEKPLIWLSFKASENPNGLVENKKTGKKIVGFFVVKGTKDHREDAYVLDELLAGPKFFDKSVKDPDAIDLTTLLSMLASAGKRINSKADKEGIQLPTDITNLLTTIEEKTAKAMPSKSNLD